MDDQPPPRRFLTVGQVAEELSTSNAQVTALIRRNELRAIQIGGRGQWRVEQSKLNDYITKAYADTRAWIKEHPFVEREPTNLRESE